MIPRKAGIYKLTNKINNKIYIGKSRNLRIRIGNHRTVKTNCAISHAIRKHGFHNFDVEILAEFDYYDNTELLALEVAFIDFFKSTQKEIGYNLCIFATDRGGIPMSAEQKQKLSQTMKGRYIGSQNPFFGQHHTSATRKLISQIHKGKTISPKECRERSIRQIGSLNTSFDPQVLTFHNKKTNETFTGTKMDFYTTFNLHRGNVSQLVLGNYHSVKGWTFVGSTVPNC